MHRNALGSLAGLEDDQVGIASDEIGEAVAVSYQQAQAAGMHQVPLSVARPGLMPEEAHARR